MNSTLNQFQTLYHSTTSRYGYVINFIIDDQQYTPLSTTQTLGTFPARLVQEISHPAHLPMQRRTSS